MLLSGGMDGTQQENDGVVQWEHHDLVCPR